MSDRPTIAGPLLPNCCPLMCPEIASHLHSQHPGSPLTPLHLHRCPALMRRYGIKCRDAWCLCKPTTSLKLMLKKAKQNHRISASKRGESWIWSWWKMTALIFARRDSIIMNKEMKMMEVSWCQLDQCELINRYNITKMPVNIRIAVLQSFDRPSIIQILPSVIWPNQPLSPYLTLIVSLATNGQCFTSLARSNCGGSVFRGINFI